MPAGSTGIFISLLPTRGYTEGTRYESERSLSQ